MDNKDQESPLIQSHELTKLNNWEDMLTVLQHKAKHTKPSEAELNFVASHISISMAKKIFDEIVVQEEENECVDPRATDIQNMHNIAQNSTTDRDLSTLLSDSFIIDLTTSPQLVEIPKVVHDFDLNNSTDPVLQDNLAFTAEPIIASAIGWPQPIINNYALTPVRLAENTNVMSLENPTKLVNMKQESHIIPNQLE